MNCYTALQPSASKATREYLPVCTWQSTVVMETASILHPASEPLHSIMKEMRLSPLNAMEGAERDPAILEIRMLRKQHMHGWQPEQQRI